MCTLVSSPVDVPCNVVFSKALNVLASCYLLWKFYHSPGNSLHLSDVGAALANNATNLEWRH